MSSTSTETSPYVAFRDELIGAGLLVPSGVPGLFGRNHVFESVIDAIVAAAVRAAADLEPQRYRFPPLLPRAIFEQTDYLRSFPNLIGSIHSFRGGDREHAALIGALESGADWSVGLSATDVVLLPACCYPVYPMNSGRVPDGGRTFDVMGQVFRHEPSDDPARMQSFRMQEFIRLGSPDEALTFRDNWIERCTGVLRSFGLPVEPVVANDPFFGRMGKMLAANQKDDELKFEITVPICSEEKPTAIASSNYHLDHFGLPFGIQTADGEVAHSACVGFGLERVTLALFRHLGLDPASWPSATREALWP